MTLTQLNRPGFRNNIQKSQQGLCCVHCARGTFNQHRLFAKKTATSSAPGTNESNVTTAAWAWTLNVWSVVSCSANCSAPTLFAVSVGHNFDAVVQGFVFEPKIHRATSLRQVIKICTAGFESGCFIWQSRIQAHTPLGYCTFLIHNCSWMAQRPRSEMFFEKSDILWVSRGL